jgi:hypothetical protein
MSEPGQTLYEHAGGDEGLHRLEEIFYAKALADPVLRRLFTERVPTHVDHLTWFTVESLRRPAELPSPDRRRAASDSRSSDLDLVTAGAMRR